MLRTLLCLSALTLAGCGGGQDTESEDRCYITSVL